MSHSRAFINTIATDVVHFVSQSLKQYPGLSLVELPSSSLSFFSFRSIFLIFSLFRKLWKFRKDQNGSSQEPKKGIRITASTTKTHTKIHRPFSVLFHFICLFYCLFHSPIFLIKQFLNSFFSDSLSLRNPKQIQRKKSPSGTKSCQSPSENGPHSCHSGGFPLLPLIFSVFFVSNSSLFLSIPLCRTDCLFLFPQTRKHHWLYRWSSRCQFSVFFLTTLTCINAFFLFWSKLFQLNDSLKSCKISVRIVVCVERTEFFIEYGQSHCSCRKQWVLLPYFLFFLPSVVTSFTLYFTFSQTSTHSLSRYVYISSLSLPLCQCTQLDSTVVFSNWLTEREKPLYWNWWRGDHEPTNVSFETMNLMIICSLYFT